MSSSILDLSGRLTEAGIDELVGLIARAPKVPAAISGQVAQVVHAHKPALIGLAKDVVVSAIKAIQAGKTEDAERIILSAAKAEQAAALYLDRASDRTSRAKIRGKASLILKGIVAALSALAMTVVADLVLGALEAA